MAREQSPRARARRRVVQDLRAIARLQRWAMAPWVDPWMYWDMATQKVARVTVDQLPEQNAEVWDKLAEQCARISSEAMQLGQFARDQAASIQREWLVS
jgi:hypothetical protein